jgi:hypothetical protein
MGMGVAKLAETVQNTDVLTIQAQATAVDTATLMANPRTYEGQWLALSGTITSGGGNMGGSSFSSGNFNSEDTTQYFLSDGVMVMDVTNSPPVGAAGDMVVAYGQIYVLDFAELSKMPLVGKAIEEEMKKDPQFAGQSLFVFFVAKQVDKVGSGMGMETPPPLEPAPTDIAPTESSTSSGWIQ